MARSSSRRSRSSASQRPRSRKSRRSLRSRRRNPSPARARAKANPTDLRDRLVDGLKAAGYVRSTAVEAAFRAVPRHVFLPDVGIEDVYTDRAFPRSEEHTSELQSPCNLV